MKIRLGMFLAGVLTTFSTVWGGYVWNSSQTSGNYSGTTNWTEDAALTGKWITSGKITLTDDVIIGNNTTDSQLTVDGATVTTSEGKRIRIGYSNATGTLVIQNDGSVTSNGCLWVGDGGQTGTISISSGGKFHVTSINGQPISYIGNSEGGKAVFLVDGGTFSTDKPMHFGHKENAEMTLTGNGSFQSTANFYLGGGQNDSETSKSGTITVGNATTAGTASFTNLYIGSLASGTLNIQQGSVLAENITVGEASSGKGLLQIVGKDVSVKTTKNLSVRSKGTLHFLADSTGLGCLEVGDTYSQSGTVTLGVAGGLACWTPEVAAAKYTLLNANDGNDVFNITNTSIWETAENDRTVQLNDDLRFSETLSLNSGILSIDTAYGTMGYLNFTGESGYFNVQLSFDGLNDLDATADLALWMASENGMENASVLDVGVIQLSSLFSADGSGILAWDWSLYNTANSTDVSLTGLAGQNVPEPATWGMLLLGIVFLMYQRRKNTK